LKRDQDELHARRKEIEKMVIESQANKDEIEKQYAQLEQKDNMMEKLNLEIQVVLTEKQTLKRELDRVDGLYNKI